MATGSQSVSPLETFAVPFPVRRFTVAEYRQMAASGILAEDEPVELLEGWITPKMTKNPAHDACVDLTNELLSSLLPPSWRIRVQSAIETDDSEPEPDIALLHGPARRWTTRHPGKGDVALVVEVAESSLQRDRNKCGIYARAAIGMYWVVNLVERHVEVYGDPSGDTGYGSRTVFHTGQQVPVILEGQTVGQIPVDALLP